MAYVPPHLRGKPINPTAPATANRSMRTEFGSQSNSSTSSSNYSNNRTAAVVPAAAAATPVTEETPEAVLKRKFWMSGLFVCPVCDGTEINLQKVTDGVDAHSKPIGWEVHTCMRLGCGFSARFKFFFQDPSTMPPQEELEEEEEGENEEDEESDEEGDEEEEGDGVEGDAMEESDNEEMAEMGRDNYNY